MKNAKWTGKWKPMQNICPIGRRTEDLPRFRHARAGGHP
jgi:hypothetical protein